MRYTQNGRACTFPEAGGETLEARVRRLENIRLIEECMFHYAKSADECDPEGMASCFTKDAVLRWGPESQPITGGRDALYRHFRSIMGKARAQEHYCTNFQILMQADDRALGVCNMHSWQIWKNPSRPETFCYGRYEFEAVTENGEWRFRSFLLTLNGKTTGSGTTAGREAEQSGRPWPPAPIK